MSLDKNSLIPALTSVFLWSTVATAFKMSLESVSVTQLLFISTLTSLLFLISFYFLKSLISNRKLPNIKHAKLDSQGIIRIISKREIYKSAFLGLLNPFGYYLILFKAYDLLPAQEALTLNYSWAIWVSVLSVPMLKHKLKLINIFWILISFTGVIIIATKGNLSDLNFADPVGTMLALSSALIWAVYWLLNSADKLDGVLRLMLNFCFGSLYVLILFIAEIIYSEENLISAIIILSNNPWGAFYVGLFEMGITFILWLAAMKNTENVASIANLVYLSPFLSLLWINIFLGEKIILSTIIGLIFVITGIILQQITKNRRISNNENS